MCLIDQFLKVIRGAKSAADCKIVSYFTAQHPLYLLSPFGIPVNTGLRWLLDSPTGPARTVLRSTFVGSSFRRSHQVSLHVSPSGFARFTLQRTFGSPSSLGFQSTSSLKSLDRTLYSVDAALQLPSEGGVPSMIPCSGKSTKLGKWKYW